MSLASIALSDPKAAYAIGRTLPLEGGLVDNPSDPGSITNKGVSLRFALAEIKAHPDQIKLFDHDHDGDVDRKDIAGLTADQAAEIFHQRIWLPGWYANLVPDIIAWKAFDIAVNTGPNRAARILQQALFGRGHDVAIDGSVGPKTVMAVRAEAGIYQGTLLLKAIRDAQATFYRGLALDEPKLGVFLKGWLNRAAA